MKIGFTGTQIGMCKDQRNQLYHYLKDLGATEFHHGDCIGADKQAHDIALAIGVDIIIHPPENDKKRAFCEGYKRRAKPLPYLDRNRRIVDTCDVHLVGADQVVHNAIGHVGDVFSALLKMNTELTIKEKSRFLVGRTEVDDQDTFVMVFR